jgi:hypothetical protein
VPLLLTVDEGAFIEIARCSAVPEKSLSVVAALTLDAIPSQSSNHRFCE